MKTHIFRQYDIRGIVGTDLTDDTVRKIGQGFGTLVKQAKGSMVSVGGDIRLSTPHLKAVLIDGILSTGVNVTDIGPCPTGAQYYSHFALDIDFGVMITGSHNPPDYNGFKLTFQRSNMFGDAIIELRDFILSGEFESGHGSLTEAPIRSAYVDFIRSKLTMKSPLKVVLDYGNGAAALVGREIFDNTDQLEVIHLFDTPDGHFPNHHPDPTVEKNLVDLQAAVRAHGADFGIGFDGDGDRIGLVDRNGDPVWGDKLLIIYAKDALSRKKQQIIFDVKCSESLIEAIEKAGGEPVMSATGHSLLKQKLKETGAMIAGEMSGHMFFGDECFGYDDAVYAAARLIRIISNSGQSIADFLADVTPYHSTPEIRLEAADDATKFEMTKQAVAFFTEHYECSTIDGVRIKFEEGWGLVRASNTQPVIVVRMEATTPERLEEYKDLIINKLSEYGELTEGGY